MKKICCAIFVTILFASCKKDAEANTNEPSPGNTVFVAASARDSKDFKGVNWADRRDNFTDDELVLSGTLATDDYAVIQTKANGILAAFQLAGANTVRLPVNPATVSGNWWKQYKGAVDKALSLNMKVILAYWEGASSKDGLVDNSFSFWKMWDTVTTAYKANGNVYFEVFNEPHGYILNDLTSLYADFLGRYPKLPGGRILLDGTGYATDVNSIGADKRFDSCLLSYHFYAWFDETKKTTADWEQCIYSLNYPARTIVTEFGVPMTGVKDYISAPGVDREISYLQGLTNAIHESNTGSIYWPGFRTDDSYSMFILSGNGLTAGNASGLSRLQYAWHAKEIMQPSAAFTAGVWYKLINKNSSKTLDVENSSAEESAAIVQWDYTATGSQQWQLNPIENQLFSIINKNSSKSVGIEGASKDAGKNVLQQTYTSGASQQWQIIDIGFGFYKIINKNSSLLLDVNGQSTSNGGNIIQWNANGGANQQWQIVALQ